MGRLFFLLGLIFFQTVLIGQTISVPFRVGDKFGISDQNGKILIVPQFDIVEIEKYDDTYFQAYTFKENTIFSSFIYKNKIVLSNKVYNHYTLSNGLVVATKYKSGKLSSYHSGDEDYYTEYEHLYFDSGKGLFVDNYKDISVVEFDNDLKLDEVLIYLTDVNNKESLLVFNSKTKKITQTIFKDVEFIKITHNSQYDYKNKSKTYIVKDINGKGKQIKIDLVKNAIKIISTEDFDLNPKKSNNREIGDDYFRDGDLVMAEPGFEAKKQISPLAILDIKKIDIKRDFYYLPKKIEEIKIFADKLSPDYCYILEKDGKKGMYFVYKKAMLIPQEYNEIFKTEMPGHFGGFILNKDNKYGFYISGMSESYFINPIFDKIPIISENEYFGKNQPLIKLFDENNKFFCYANKDGKLYYSEK